MICVSPEGWNVNNSTDAGLWPLLVAAKCGNVNITQMLIDTGARSKTCRRQSELHVLADAQRGPFPLSRVISPDDGQHMMATRSHSPCLQDFEMAKALRWTSTLHGWLRGSENYYSVKLWQLLISAGASPNLYAKRCECASSS